MKILTQLDIVKEQAQRDRLLTNAIGIRNDVEREIKSLRKAPERFAYMCIGGEANTQLRFFEKELEEGYQIELPTEFDLHYCEKDGVLFPDYSRRYVAGTLFRQHPRYKESNYRVLYQVNFRQSEENLSTWFEVYKPNLQPCIIRRM